MQVQIGITFSLFEYKLLYYIFTFQFYLLQPEEQWKDFEEKPQVYVSDLEISQLNLEDKENDGSDANDED